MSDENNNNPLDLNGRKPDETAFQTKDEEVPTSEHSKKIALFHKVKEISQSEDWILTQEIAQDIEAEHIRINPDGKRISSPKLIELIKEEIIKRYSEDEETMNLLIDSIPGHHRVTLWRKMDGWDEAVWSRLRSNEMFNHNNRFKVIDALLQKAVKDKDVAAAKIWLTLSGDYSDKMDINTDKRVEAYREINSILHNKKKAAE